MENTLTGVLAGALLVAAVGVGLASPANATIATIGERDDWSADNYRDELRYSGLVHEDSDNAFGLAMRTCGDRSHGWPSAVLERRWMRDPYYTTENAVVIVRNAEFHFCSQYGDD